MWFRLDTFPVFEDSKAAVLSVSAALLAFGRLVTNAPGPRFGTLRLPVYVFALSLVAALAVSRPLLGESVHATVRLGILAMFVWALCGTGPGTLAFTGAVSAVACAAAVVASLADISVHPFWGDPPGFLSPIGYVTYVGTTLALQLPWAVAWAVRSKGMAGRMGWGTVSLLLLVGIKLTAARG